MPDKVGAFVSASKIISEIGLNITRVSYNKAVDTHILFIEVEGDKDKLDVATEKLKEQGYLLGNSGGGKVVLIEFVLRDKPGVLVPVLELINSFNFNISYISSHANGTDYQNFRMGLFVDNGKDISEFLRRATELCELRIINYDHTETVLDNTVFYISFANQIAEKLNLTEKQKSRLIVNSNLVMEQCAATTRQYHKTFDYISRFADYLIAYKGDNFQPRITETKFSNGVKITLIESQCGSNVILFSSEKGTAVFDSGYPRYKKETLNAIKSVVSDFSEKENALLLTHNDVDHIGLIDEAEKVYLSRNGYMNFISERETKKDFREQNPVHAPYIKISKILADYTPPKLDNAVIMETENQKFGDLTRIGTVNLFGFTFEVYEGNGGHVKGECIYIERNLKAVITGDVFVNLKDLTKEHTKFIKLAPYLMTSVDTDKEKAASERKEIFNLLDKGDWKVYCGHGALKTVSIE